ncbi:DNA polymerase kappa isoform X2 [Sphaerodactylus townsendi]|uniref:DNA polymerase kappa isoform X2 n=1 Tax=Sphaerodactylus townsendi TaxID=933632 RepID=UPI002025D055|nr:DNA polymerase kappa isoform X2 [Sphaerodactylus townsendi]
MDSPNNSCVSSQAGLLLRMGLNDNKAGMQGLDKEKINRVIMEASKGSKFYEHELKKDQQVNKRIEKILKLKSKITDQQIMKAQLQIDKIAMELEQTRDLSSAIVHIDMDAFYAAVEMKDNPELRDKPIAVGSLRMLSTSNYHARRFGVRAAMPGFIAKKLCPHLTIVPLNFKKYQEVREILAEYDPHFMPVGLDEAYLNITEYLEERKNWQEDKRKYFSESHSFAVNDKHSPVTCDKQAHPSSPGLSDDDPVHKQSVDPPVLHPEDHQQSTSQISSVGLGISAEEVVKEIRCRVEERTGLTASAGIAPNMMLAKMCSDQNKPNGQFRIPPEREAVMNFIKDLPIRKVPGIGKVTEKMLKALGIVTCANLYQQRALISLLFSEISWRSFLEISLGLGSTHLERDGERKSMSTERTFNEISAPEQYRLCQELCSDLAEDLQKEGLKARTVTLKLKNVNFEMKTRATTVLTSVSTGEEIFAVAKELLKTEMESVAPQPLRLRLMGVRVSGFLNEEEKKYQQRSIVHFLDSASRCPPGKSSEDIFPKAPERESFFNKKRATRKQDNPETSVNESSTKQNPQDGKSAAATGQAKDNDHQIFICPVCFKEHPDSSLEAFNRHIDSCLSETVEKENAEMTKDRENKTDLSMENQKNKCQSNKTSELCVEMQPTHTVNNSVIDVFPPLECSEYGSQSGYRCPDDIIFDMPAEQDISSKLLSVEKEHSEESNCTETELPCFSTTADRKSLVCPVCNVKQNTEDLALFNEHVDVCLNKGIIKELTESSKSMGNFDREQCGTNSTTGTKRSGTMGPQSIAKKAKSNNSKCTIDTFFR